MGCSKLGDAIDQNMSVDENLKFNKDTILRLRGSKDCAVRAYVEMCTIIDRIKRADLPPDEAATAIREAAVALVCLDRPYRWACLKALLETYAETPSIFWPLFITWWPDKESRSGWSATVARALSFGSAQKYMRPEDRECFTALPDPVSIYRGQLAGRHAGIAWTTDREWAERFARRSALFFGGEPTLLTGRVKKADIIAVLTERKESEVIVLPRHVRNRSSQPVRPCKLNPASAPD